MLQCKEDSVTLLLEFPVTVSQRAINRLNFIASVTGCLVHTTGETWIWEGCMWNSLFRGLRGNVTVQKSQICQKMI